MSTELDALRAGLDRLLPLRSGRFRLELAAASPDERVRIDERGGLVVVLRVLVYDGPDGDSLDDVKEQELYLGEFARHPPERWLAYIEGTARAAPVICAEADIDPRALMPIDLFSYWEVLADPSLHSGDDFAAALSDAGRLAPLDDKRHEELWADALEPCGLAEQTKAVRALVRPALRVELERDESGDESDDAREALPPVGQSRFGGDPDLPAEVPWPEHDGAPLVFVAQFDLAALARYTASQELPSDGLLSFFYDPQGDHTGHAVRVLHFANPQSLSARSTPAKGTRLVPHAVRCTPERHLPAVESQFFYHSLLPADRVVPYYERLEAGDGSNPPIAEYPLSCLVRDQSEREFERPSHHLLGHPDSIQGDPYLDVEMTTHANGWGDFPKAASEQYELRTRALRWRLLLQIDAQQDGELLLNQDGGYFYFWMPDDALATHDWGRARGMLQCH